jgi:hypothetical protein
LKTVRYAEFSIPSCHRGSNELIHIGKNLLPFLSTYIPHLQTLRLWRQDDFLWTFRMYISKEIFRTEVSIVDRQLL